MPARWKTHYQVLTLFCFYSVLFSQDYELFRQSCALQGIFLGFLQILTVS